MRPFDPIGLVRSPVTEMSRGQWGNVCSEIHIDQRFLPGLKGLEDFSHIIVIFLLDRAEFDPARHLQRRPRGREEIPLTGVFAQRTKYRPNPIGVTTVALLSIDRQILTVRGLDALDQTPVLDIKPYMPLFDRVEFAALPDWCARFQEGYF